MRPPTFSTREVARLAAEVLDATIVETEHIPAGFVNENHRVTDGDGRRFVVKIGPIASAAKWRSTRTASELATSVGIPVPGLVAVEERGDHVVRVFEWVEGRSPVRSMQPDPAYVARLFDELGAAVARMHTIELDAFSSRLDGSAPVFPQWSDYVDYRLHQIRNRCAEQDALELATLDRACMTIAKLAAEIGDAARPTLCHRDLSADNLLTDGHGALIAILDWDAAEGWDQAAEWFKLDWLLLPAFTGAETAFEAAYDAVHPERPRWTQRKALVELMEALNTVANATARRSSSDLEERARAHLRSLL